MAEKKETKTEDPTPDSPETPAVEATDEDRTINLIGIIGRYFGLLENEARRAISDGYLTIDDEVAPRDKFEFKASELEGKMITLKNGVQTYSLVYKEGYDNPPEATV